MQEVRVELRNRHRLEHHLPAMPIAAAEPEDVIDEVELDLEVKPVDGCKRGAQAAGGYTQGDMPRVINPGRKRQAHLAHDLCPQLQGGTRVLSRRVRKLRPRSGYGCFHLAEAPDSAEPNSSIGGIAISLVGSYASGGLRRWCISLAA